jgi:hypothetical protein
MHWLHIGPIRHGARACILQILSVKNSVSTLEIAIDKRNYPLIGQLNNHLFLKNQMIN